MDFLITQLFVASNYLGPITSEYSPQYLYIQTYIPMIYKLVTMNKGCGKSHNTHARTHTHKTNFYNVKLYRHFIKQYYGSFYKKIHIENKEYVLTYI